MTVVHFIAITFIGDDTNVGSSVCGQYENENHVFHSVGNYILYEVKIKVGQM